MALTEPTTPRVVYSGWPEGMKITLKSAATCNAGDLLGYNSGWVLADGNGVYDALLVAGEDGTSAQEITAYAGALIGGFTLGTPGGEVYLSDTAGDYTETASTTSSQHVGYVLSASTIMVEPRRNKYLGAGANFGYGQKSAGATAARLTSTNGRSLRALWACR